MSFTKAYFNFGYESTLEKVAKKDDEGMSTAAKLGIGAGALGLGGLGAYYSPEIISGAADLTQDYDVGDRLSEAAQWAQENLKNPMRTAGGKVQQLLHNAPAMFDQAKSKAGELGEQASSKAGELADQAKDKLGQAVYDAKIGLGSKSLRAPSPGSESSEYLKHMADKVRGVVRTQSAMPHPGIDTSVNALPGGLHDVTGIAKDYWDPKLQKAIEFIKNNNPIQDAQ